VHGSGRTDSGVHADAQVAQAEADYQAAVRRFGEQEAK